MDTILEPLLNAKVLTVNTQGEYPKFDLYLIELEKTNGTKLSLEYSDFSKDGTVKEAEGKNVMVEGTISQPYTDGAGVELCSAHSDTCILRVQESEEVQPSDPSASTDAPQKPPVREIGFEQVKEDMTRLGNVAYEAIRQSILVHSAIHFETGFPVSSEAIRQTGTSLFIESMKVRKWPLTNPDREFASEKDAEALIKTGLNSLLEEQSGADV